MTATLTITSAAFAQGERIPSRYTCDGQEYSPALAWSGAPATTQSYVLLVHDPDAPAKDWLHWLVINIPPTTTSVAEQATPTGGVVLPNDSNEAQYGGPCPPNGEHRYFFTVYALDIPELKSTSRSQVEASMAGHILAQGELLGRYIRP